MTLRANEDETPPPGNLDLSVRKDSRGYAYASDTDRLGGCRRQEHRSPADAGAGTSCGVIRIVRSPRRRTFTAQDKLRILAETDLVADSGGIGAIPRREGLYSSALTEWRRQRDAGAFGALVPARRGRKTVKPNPLAADLVLLQRDIEVARFV